MYKNLNVKIKWNNGISENVEVKQGIRQGAKLSTVLYKRYNNNILNALDRSNMGAEIGNIRVVAPTCADDIALLVSTQSAAQALLDIVSDITSTWLKSIQVSLNLYHLQKDTVILVCVWTQKRSNKQQKLNIWE
jgi:hypothetical protein